MAEAMLAVVMTALDNCLLLLLLETKIVDKRTERA